MNNTESRKKVLFICTGNTCRSPMAERYFNAVCAPAGVIAGSAGLYADDGSMMSFGSQRALAAYGVDGSSFRSRQLTSADAEAAELLIGMGSGHCAEITRRFPQCAEKCVKLLDFIGGGDVADPFGGNDTVYRHCLEEMIPALEKIAENLSETNL